MKKWATLQGPHRAKLQASLFHSRERRLALLSPATGVQFSDELSDGAGTPVTMTTTIDSRPTFQRGGSGVVLQGALDVVGDEDASGMAWRIGSSPWVQFSSETITSNSWQGTLIPPANYIAQGTLQIKPINGENVTPAEVSNVTSTDVYVVMGQSNADGLANNLQVYSGTNYFWSLAKATGGFDVFTTEPTFNSNGSLWPHFATALDSIGIPPAIFGPVTIDGSGFGNGNWNPGDTLYNQAVSRSNTTLARTGGAKALIWVQGEADANSVAYGDAWDDAWEAMWAQMQIDVPHLSGLPAFITMIGEKSAVPGLNNLRRSVLNVINGDTDVYHGPNLLNEVFGDGVHYGSIGGSVDATEAEAQLIRIANMHLRTAVELDGPATFTAAVTGTYQVTCTFDRDMQNHSDTTGWNLEDTNTGVLTIVSATQGASAREVILTTSQVLFGDVSVSYGEDEDASGGTLTDTDSTIPMPPIFTWLLDAGEAVGLAPTLTSSPTISGTSKVGQQLTGSDGSYNAVPSATVGSYQWQRSTDSGANWNNISGATFANYTPVALDEAAILRRGETATNSAGSLTSYSAATNAVLSEDAFANPADLASTIRWWDASQTSEINTDSGDSVFAWTSPLPGDFPLDRDGGGTSFAPVTNLNTINSLNVIYFDGDNDVLYADVDTTGISPQFDLRAGSASQFEGVLTPLDGSFVEISDPGTDRSGVALWEIQFDAVNNTATLFHGIEEVGQSAYTGPDNTHFFFVAEVLGSSNANDGLFSYDTTDTLRVGRSSGSQYANARIGEIIICDEILSVSDAGDMRAYLNNKWVLGLTPIVPSVVTNPTIPTGAPSEGSSFSASGGSYSGTPTPSITARQWQISNDGTSGWTNISGATSTSYTPVSGDIGKFLRYTETSSNSEGSVTGISASSAQIIANAGLNNPSDITSVIEWWQSTAGITTSGVEEQYVSSWASSLTGGTTLDRNGGGESFAPLTTTRTENSLNVIDFDGGNDVLYSPIYGSPILPRFTLAAGNASIFYGQLQELDGTFSDTTVDSTDRSGIGLWEVIFNSTDNTVELIHNLVSVVNVAYSGSVDAHLFMVVNVDGSGNTNDALFCFNTEDRIRLMRNEGSQYGDAAVAEIVIASSELTGSDLTDLRDYFDTRWSIGLTPAAPTLVSNPTLPAGDPSDGVGYTATTGSYDGTPPPSITARQWQISDDGSTGWSNISGATSITYTPVTANVGKFLRYTETSSNSEGSVVGTSASSNAVGAAAAFSDPSDNPNVYEWWSPTNGVTTTDVDNERVSEWATSLSSGTTLLRVGGESLGPTTAIRTLNGVNVFDFDGANDQIRQDSANSTLPEFSFSAGNASTFYGKLDSESGDFTDVTGSAVDRSGAALWEITIDSTAGEITLYRSGVQVCQATDLSWSGSANAHIFIAADIDGSGNANDSIFTNHSTQGIRIGQYWGGQYGDFGCGDIVISSQILSGSDLTDMRGYFNTRWGF